MATPMRACGRVVVQRGQAATSGQTGTSMMGSGKGAACMGRARSCGAQVPPSSICTVTPHCMAAPVFSCVRNHPCDAKKTWPAERAAAVHFLSERKRLWATLQHDLDVLGHHRHLALSDNRWPNLLTRCKGAT